MDYGDYYGFNPYVSVGARRAQAARELAKLQKKGRKISPVVIEGRTIAVFKIGFRRHSLRQQDVMLA